MAKWIPVFKIEGVTLPIPDSYNQTVIDLSSDESGRLLDGTANKDVVAIKSSVPLKWDRLEWQVASNLANAVDGKTELTVQIMDVRHPYVMTTQKVYVGDRKFEPVQFDDDGKVYWSVDFSEIER